MPRMAFWRWLKSLFATPRPGRREAEAEAAIANEAYLSQMRD